MTRTHQRVIGIVLGAIIALPLGTVAAPAASAKSVDPVPVGDVEATDRSDLTVAERNEIDATQDELMDLILEGKSHAEIESEMGLETSRRVRGLGFLSHPAGAGVLV